MGKVIRLALCLALAGPLSAVPFFGRAQDKVEQPAQEDQNPPEAQPAPEEQTSEGAGYVQGFKVQPTVDNTYVVTYDLRGLSCVRGVGSPSRCAVTNQSADEGGYPWTMVKCRHGDSSRSTFAWSLDNNGPMEIFEAPPSLRTSAKLFKMNVRLGRVCMKSTAGSGGNHP